MRTTRDEDPRQIEIAGSADLRASGLLELTRDLIRDARAPATRQAYRSDLLSFVEWCEAHGLDALPAGPQTVAAYVAHQHQEGRAPSSIDRALTAISQAHKLKGHESPCASPIVRETRAGMRRRASVAQKKARPITLEHLERMLEGLEGLEEPKRSRDRAVLALGWAAALRRAELAAIQVADLREHSSGLVLTLKRSKGDQEGEGREIGIPFGVRVCPVRAVAKWRELADIDDGPLFRSIYKGGTVRARQISARSIDRIVRHAAQLAGYSETYSAHGLRAGFATAAAEMGLPDREIMRHTGHRSSRVFAGYVRSATVFSRNPLTVLLGSPPQTPSE